MIEGEQRVRFAAAKAGLEINYGVTAGSTQALQGIHQQPPQAVREKGALEEIARDAIFCGADTVINLRQVGCELGKLVAPRSDIGMGCNDLAPGTQPGYRFALNGYDRDFACLVAGLFLEAHTQQFLPLPFNLAGQLASRDGGEQALDAIQGT